LRATIVAGAAAPGDRLPGLDLLRATAVAWVLIYHAAIFDLVRPSWLVRFGWMGVDLFFALSGYLIAGQLFRPLSRGESPGLGRFFMRRWMRTLPAYLAVLAVYALLPPLRDQPDLLPLWRFLTFTQNLGLDPDPPKAFSHAWSLCVEEQFYLALPLALALIAPLRRPRLGIAVLAGLVGAGMALRGWLWLHDVARAPFDPAALPRAGRYMTLIYYSTWTRLDDLLAGIALAAMPAFRPRWWAAAMSRCNLLFAAGLAGVAASAMVFQDQIAGFAATAVGFPLLAASMALTVAGASSPRAFAARLAGRPVRALAAGAYSLYLSHKLVYHAAQAGRAAHPATPPQLWLAAALAGALVLGAALYWGVERPFLRLRERLGARSAQAIEAPAAAE
jgi:peptidoglycan/LPS O-acetylase OafA/YrhL